ncbi:MAG: YlqD family protein [Armatimonadetes bacterium]|nr:YlqD family protein [Armatimonadota bacterium]
MSEEFKAQLNSELQEAATETQRRIEQMEMHSRRLLAELQRSDLSQAMQARKQIEAERQRHDALKQDIQRQLQEVDKLEIESEYPLGTVEGVVELNQGDDLVQKLSGSQIVIKDGVIVELREA